MRVVLSSKSFISYKHTKEIFCCSMLFMCMCRSTLNVNFECELHKFKSRPTFIWPQCSLLVQAKENLCIIMSKNTSLKNMAKVGEEHNIHLTKGLCHILALPFALKSILRQKKKNYGNSKYFTMQKIYSSKNPLKETKNPSRYNITLL